jgi:hypothetical protein
VACIFVSPYWKAGHWTFKKKTNKTILGKDHDSMLELQKKKNKKNITRETVALWGVQVVLCF